METFTLDIAIGLNTTHAFFYAESVNAAVWNRARLVEAKLSCFCWCINALMKSTRLDKFPKRPWIREYGTGKEQYIFSENYKLFVLNSTGKTPS